MNSLIPQDDEELKRQILLRSLIGNNPDYGKPMVGNEGTAGVARGVSNAADLFVGRKPQYPVGNSSKLADAMALANYKQGLKTDTTPDGYTSENDIPKTMAGLPLEGVSSKDGRLVPTYKTPSSGLLGADGGPSMGDYNLQGEDYLNSLSPQQRETVKAIANYASDPNHEFAGLKGAAQRAPYIEAARHYDSSYDPMEYKKRADYLKDFTSGKRATNRLAGNTLIKHMGSLEDTLQDTPSSGVGFIEKGQRFAAKQLPGFFPKQAEAMTNEDTALNAVAGELSNVFKQTGGTDTEIGSWLDAYDKNAPRELKQSYIKKGVELLQGRISALGNEYEQTMGRSYNKPLITPDAESIVNRTLFKNPYGGMKQQPSFGNNQIQEFPNEDALNAANLPKGTKVKVAGQNGTVG